MWGVVLLWFCVMMGVVRVRVIVVFRVVVMNVCMVSVFCDWMSVCGMMWFM